MARSFADYRASQTQAGAWTQNISVAPAGSLAAPLFAMYPSLGDVTIATATNIDTVQDGPMKVVRYGALTVNALLTVTQRCRGLIILCDSLVMGAAGSISMSARGAAGCSKWPIVDLTIPQSVALSAGKISQRDVLSYITQNGIWIGDPVFWAFPDAGVADCRASITAGGVALLSAAGCGTTPVSGYVDGNAGSSGGTGSGGAGVGYGGGYGGAGRPWGGGVAGGSYGQHPTTGAGSAYPADNYGGVGGIGLMGTNGYTCAGGTGNPGGTSTNGVTGNNGTGGVLVIICRGNVSLVSGSTISANGVNGAAQATYQANGSMGGSASGGGHVSLVYGGTYSNAGTITAFGGIGGAASGGTYPVAGRAGGAGSVVTKTFAQMGWT